MATMFVRHKVDDFGKWKSVYDEFKPTRKKMGVKGASVHRDANEPDIVFVTHEFKDLDTAKAFADSEELKSAMANAGVTGPPQIWFTEDIERTPH